MVRRCLVVLVLVCSSFADPGAQEQARIDESRLKVLLSPLERLASVNRRSWVKPEELRSAMDEACGALQALSKDEEFNELIHFYQENQYNNNISPEVSTIYSEFEQFLEFLKIERELLLQYLSDQAVDEILGRMLATRERAKNFRIDPDAIMSSLNETEEAICKSVQEISDSMDRAEQRSLVGRATLTLAGAVTVSVDIVLGPTPWAVVSGTTGLFLMWLAS